MAFVSALAVLALVVSAEGSVGPSTNTSFCTESKECLEYELVCKTDEYEVRHYSPTRWVSTDAEAYFMGVGAAMAFRRLFQYITGANEGGVQMEMTAPVLVRIPEETKMWEPAIYTLNFPLPAAYQDKPPTPTNDKLYFTEMPEMDVYVRSYGGWMLSVTSRLHAHLLTKELERVHASYNHTFHYGVGYDSPLKLLNRHNEVWYVAEGTPVCTDPQEPTPAHTPKPTQTQSPTESPSSQLAHTLSISPSEPLPQMLSDSPSEPLPQMLSDSPSDPLPLTLSDSPSEPLPQTLSDAPLPHTVSDSPSAAPSNLSCNSTSEPSPEAPSDTPSLPPSHSAASPTSHLPSDADTAADTAATAATAAAAASSSHPPTSAHILLDPTANYSDPASASPSLEPLGDASQWNSTAHGSVDTQADSNPVVEPHNAAAAAADNTTATAAGNDNNAQNDNSAH